MTAAELLALPEDGQRHELVKGELRSMAPAGGVHGDTAGTIHLHLGRFLYEHPVGRILAAETGFHVGQDPDTVRAPDVAVVRVERIPPEGLPRGYIPGAPDLAVEVVSPGDTATDVQEKVDEWLGAGARLVWVVHQRGPRLVVHRPDGSARTLGPDDDVEGEDVLPGFCMRLRDLLHPFRR